MGVGMGGFKLFDGDLDSDLVTTFIPPLPT